MTKLIHECMSCDVIDDVHDYM